MSVYVKNKLVSSKVDQFVIKDNMPLTNIVDRLSMPEVLHDYLRVSIDGIVIPKENWQNTIATTRHVVFIAVVPQGGDSGKNPLAMIAMVALSVFTMGVVSPWASIVFGTATAGAVAAAGVMFVGMLAISALFPPPTISSPSMKEDSAGFLGMEGLRNAQRAHQAVRVIYGTYKVAPDVAVEPYVLTRGDMQTLYAIYDFGYGEINVENILIGNTPIDEYTSTYSIHKGYTNGELDYYRNDNSTESFATEVDGTQVTRTTATGTDEVYVDIRFPSGLAKFPEGKGIRKAYAKFEVYVEKTDGSTGLIPLGEVPHVNTSHVVEYAVQPPATLSLPDLYTDYPNTSKPWLGYSLRNASNTFSGFATGVEVSRSSLAVDPLTILANTEITIEGILYTVVSASVPVIALKSRITSSFTDGHAGDYNTYTYYKVATYSSIVFDKSTTVGSKIPYVKWYDCDTYSGWCFTAYSPAPVKNTKYKITYEKTAIFTLARTISKSFVFSLHIVFPSNGEWDIHIKRLPAYLDHPSHAVLYLVSAYWDNKWTDRTELVAIQSVSTSRDPLNFKAPHTILELKIEATDKLSGAVDTLSALCQPEIPYYSGGVLAGTKVTSNPAWIALDVLMSDKSPDPIPLSRIDIDAFEDWSIFCGDTNDDTDDYHCDCNWTASSTVFERLTSVFSSGRATIASRENKYSVIWESFPTTPVQMFTTANSWGFKGSKIFTKKPHAINVEFIDPYSEWQMIDRIVYADGYAEVDGGGNLAATYFENIKLPHCTNSDRAWKAGRYYIAQGTLRPESFTLTTDIENLICERGDLISLQYDAGRVGGLPSRITAISGAVVTLREPVGWEATPNYYLRIRKDDGTQEEIQVISQTDSYTITLNSIPNPVANVGDLVIYGEEDLVYDEFLVKSVSPGQDLTATIDLVPLAADIANADTGTIPDYTPPISSDIMVYPVCLSNVSVVGKFYYEERQPFIDVTLNWSDIATNTLYEIWLSIDGTENYTLVDTIKHTVDYLLFNRSEVLDTSYNATEDHLVKVLPVNAFGYKPKLESCIATAFLLPKDDTPPSDVSNFQINISSGVVTFTWDEVVDDAIKLYEIRYDSWWSGEDIKADTFAKVDYPKLTYSDPTLTLGIHEFSIKAVDLYNNYSEIHTVASIELIPPVMDSISHIFKDKELIVSWEATANSFVISHYEIRIGGTDWTTATFLTNLEGNTYTEEVSWINKIVHVRAVDEAGNYSSNYLTDDITIVGPLLLSFTVIHSSDSAILSWEAQEVSLSIDHYIIKHGDTDWSSATTIDTIMGSTYTIPALWGDRTFRIKAFDSFGTESTNELTVQSSIVVPSTPVVNHTFVSDSFIVDWTTTGNDLSIKEYEIRKGGATWETASFIKRTTETSYTEVIDSDTWVDAIYWIKTLDIANNESVIAGSTSVEITTAQTPILSEIFDGRKILLSWVSSRGTLPISSYELRYGGASWETATVLGIYDIDTFSEVVEWATRNYRVKTIDVAGFYSSEGSKEIVINNPSISNITTQVIDNNVLFYWTISAGTLPSEEVEIRRVDSEDNSTVIGKKTGTFTVLFEPLGGTYTYYIAPIDTAGNKGSEVSKSILVNEPPDYVLRADWNSDLSSGTKVNMAIVDSTLSGPYNLTETYEEHYFNNLGTAPTTPQDFIDAGYPYYAQPTLSTGSYVETFDYGANLPATKISLTLTKENIVGSIVITPTISVSLDNSSWTDYVGVFEVIGTDFRYVKVTLNFSQTGDTDIIQISNLNLKLDVKLKNDAGSGSASSGDSGGTTVAFNVSFIDVESISVTANSTTAITAVYDFLDAANPTDFKVLLFDKDGTRVTNNFSWAARGY